MKHKNNFYISILLALTASFYLTALLTENAVGSLQDPEVEVIPSEVYVDQEAVVQAVLHIKSC